MSETSPESQSDLTIRQLKQIKQLSDEAERQRAEAQRHLAGRQLAELKLNAVAEALGARGASAEALGAQVQALLSELQATKAAHAALRDSAASLAERATLWSRFVERGATGLDLALDPAARATALARFADQLLLEHDARFRSAPDDGA